MGASPLQRGFIADAAGAKVRSLHSPKRDHAAATRVTTDVGAFLRNHANGRAQSTNDGSVSSTHYVSPLLLQTCTYHQVTSCCSAAKRRNLANGLIIDILKLGRYKCAIYKHNGTPLTALLNGELCLTEQL